MVCLFHERNSVFCLVCLYVNYLSTRIVFSSYSHLLSATKLQPKPARFYSKPQPVSVRCKPDALVALHDVALARLACVVQWLSFLPPAAAPPALLAFARRLLALLSATAIQVRKPMVDQREMRSITAAGNCTLFEHAYAISAKQIISIRVGHS